MIFSVFTKILLFSALLFSFVPKDANREVPFVAPLTPTEQTSTSATPQTISTEATTTPKVAVKPAIKSAQVAIPKTTSTPPVAQQTPLQTITPPASSISFETINENARKAVVNILCTANPSGPLSPITGSGIMVSSNGLILTNAHIAQYFLLKDFNNQKDFLTCTIRTGNPAYPSYTAELVYIPPVWVEKHKTDIIKDNPQSTGEHDYAFIRITGRIDGTPAPDNFPFIPPNLIEFTEIGTPAVLVSYPAGFLGGQTIIQSLYQSSAVISITDRYTFGDNTVDLISLGGSVVAQKGSSGGATVDQNGELIGLITTSSDGQTTANRELRALTAAYIQRDLIKNATQTISSLASNSASFAKTFNANIAPGLTKALSDVILKK